MLHEKFAPRILHQQTKRDSDMQQQQAGGNDGQSQAQGTGQKAGQEMGEGSYEATRDYQKNIGEYLEKADVEADGEAAKPRSAEEAEEMKKAEQEGLSHSKGEH